jgi:hypothetical protein
MDIDVDSGVLPSDFPLEEADKLGNKGKAGTEKDGGHFGGAGRSVIMLVANPESAATRNQSDSRPHGDVSQDPRGVCSRWKLGGNV